MDRQRPNILFLMADQFRWDYLGCMGAPFVRTPNLDRLAARGVTFTQCCSNAPVCAPARIGLATGNQPVRHGALDNHAFLPLRQPTYYQRLRDHGYRVGCVGKLDLAKPDPYNGRHGDRPLAFAWGFTHPEECEGKMHAGRGNPPIGPYTFWLAEQGLNAAFCADYARRQADGWLWRAAHDSVLPTRAFEDVYIGQRAAKWLREAPDDFPWHYFVSFVGPHDPFDPPTEYAERYRQAAVPPALDPEGANRPNRRRHGQATADEIAVCRRQYCAAIEVIDDQIGAILRAVEERGQHGRTYVVFSSDHGEMLGDHGCWTKNVCYEASLRVPLLVAGPGIAGGQRSEALVELIDLNPTILDWAGAPRLEDTDAHSLIPLLAGESGAIHSETVAQLRAERCIRTHDWKLILHAGGGQELYDLRSDPNELHNVAEANGGIVSGLSHRLTRRFLEGGCTR